MISTGELKKGVIIEMDNQLYSILDYQHQKIGRGSAQVRMKLRNVRTGSISDTTVQAGTKFPRVRLEQRAMQYLYAEDQNYYFMDQENYEQLSLSAEFLEGQSGFLLPNTEVQVNFYNGRPIGVELPPSVILTVTDTEPGIRNSTATNSFKPAVMETGITVQVPPFINKGERIKVDTNEGKYMERA